MLVKLTRLIVATLTLTIGAVIERHAIAAPNCGVSDTAYAGFTETANRKPALESTAASSGGCPSPPKDPPGPTPIVRVPGKGSGEGFECTAEPGGSPAEIAAFAAAVEAGAVADPQNPHHIEQVVNPGAVLGEEVTLSASWFKMTDGVPYMLYTFHCPDRVGVYYDWLPVTASGGSFVPQPRPEDLVPDLYERVVRQLPTPVPRVAPADWMPEQWTYVNVSTFFWVDQAPGQWAPVVAQASLPGLTVTAQAEPVRLVVHPGDGADPVICRGAPPPYDQNRHDPDTFQGCEYTYRDSSAMADNGETFPLTVDVVWHATWTASNGASGELGHVSTASEVRWLPVAEIQAVITDTHSG